MDDYMSARSDVYFTGHDGTLRSNRLICQAAGLYACDMFIGSTLQIDLAGNSSTVTPGRVAGFGGAPNMGADAHGRRHPSAAWLKAGREASDGPTKLIRGRKLVVQILETFGEKKKPNFVETLDSRRDGGGAELRSRARDDLRRRRHPHRHGGRDRQPAPVPRSGRARTGDPRRRRLHRRGARAGSQGRRGAAAARGHPPSRRSRRRSLGRELASCWRPTRSRIS